MAVRGAGVGSDWRISRMEAQIAGVTATATGSIRPDRIVRADAEIAVADPAVGAAHLRSWFPDAELPEVGGGPIEGTLRIEGSIDEPAVDADLTWIRPMVAGRELHSISVSGIGGLEGLQWLTRVEVEDDSAFEARGMVDPRTGSIEGDWEFAISDLARMVEILTPDIGVDRGRRPRRIRFAGVVAK